MTIRITNKSILWESHVEHLVFTHADLSETIKLTIWDGQVNARVPANSHKERG